MQKPNCLQLVNPQDVANYVNSSTTAIASTLPGIATVAVPFVFGMVWAIRVGRALLPKAFAGQKDEALEAVLSGLADKLQVEKEVVTENLEQLVLTNKPKQLALKLAAEQTSKLIDQF